MKEAEENRGRKQRKLKGILTISEAKKKKAEISKE